MPRQIMGETYLNIKEVADMMGVTPLTVQRYINGKKIEAFKIGGKWLMKEATIKAFVDQRSNIRDGSIKLPNIAA